jgi:lipid-binding SYLF domain-containing protein
MNWKRILSFTATIGILCCFFSPLAQAGAEEEKIEASLNVLREVTRIPEKSIPPTILREAHAIVIIPDAIRVGLVVGGKYGAGILMVHRNGEAWSNPSFVSMREGSLGCQIGAEATDLILVFKNSRSIEGIKKGKFTIGADASVAAGPVGRSVSAATDPLFKAEILSYSRNRGVFAGVSLGGASIQIEDEANASFYNRPGIQAHDILYGEIKSHTGTIWKIKELLTEYAKPATP